MLPIIAVIISGGGIGALLLWLAGVILCVAIVYAIMKTLDSPPWMYKALYVLALVVLLILTIDFFFGVGGDLTIRNPR